MRYFIGFLLTILLSSCAMTNYYTKTVASWHGANATTLVNRWGRPDEKIIGPHGNSIYVYKTISYKQNSAPASPMIGVTFGADGKPIIITIPNTNNTWNRGMSISCVAVFMVNKQNIVTETKVQGNNCYGNANFAEKRGNPSVKIE